jgi:hypothetical protein
VSHDMTGDYSPGPVVTLGLHGVVLPSCLEERFLLLSVSALALTPITYVDTSTTSDDSNGSPSKRSNDLLGTRRHPDPGLSILSVTDDGSVVSGSPGERSTVTDLLLDVADDGSLWELSEGENVSDVKGSLLSAVDEGSGGETLGGDERLLADLVLVGVTEVNDGEGGTAKRGQNEFEKRQETTRTDRHRG